MPQGCEQRGPFSHVREWPPLNPPREREGSCPSTPLHCEIEARRAARPAGSGAVYVASPRVSANRYQYQPRLTIVRRV
nr:MAG TPA: hypothetical protein [Caudoviricetes sp.]